MMVFYLALKNISRINHLILFHGGYEPSMLRFSNIFLFFYRFRLIYAPEFDRSGTCALSINY